MIKNFTRTVKTSRSWVSLEMHIFRALKVSTKHTLRALKS